MFLLIDCNNFFVSCERVFRPDLAHRPVIVLSNNDGCVVSRSNEAKHFGIAMGVPFFRCKEIIAAHNVTVFSANFALYGDCSDRVMRVIMDFADAVEVYSIDEAFVEMLSMNDASLVDYARTLRARILRWTGIPVSVGIGQTKTLAKVANEWAKTHADVSGVMSLADPAAHDVVLQQTDIRNVWGIGPSTAQFLRGYNVQTAREVTRCSERWMRQQLKRPGTQLWRELRGIVCYLLQRGIAPRKSIVSSRSFGRPVTTLIELQEAVASYMTIAAEKLRAQHSAAACVNVFMRGTDSRSNTVQLPTPTAYTPTLIDAAHHALAPLFQLGIRYKKAGVCLTGIVPETHLQANLFHADYTKKQQRLMRALDTINARWGMRALQVAAAGIITPWKMKSAHRSPRYTTAWDELPIARRQTTHPSCEILEFQTE